MNLKYNPISYIRNTSVQMYCMVALSLLWTLTFCTLIAGWMNVIPLIWGHVGFVFAVFFTYGIFEDAKRDGAAWFKSWARDYKEESNNG